MKKLRKTLLVLIPLLVVLAVMPDTAFAATNGVHSITTAFSSAASGWYTQVKKVAEELFVALFGIEIVWMVVQWLVTGKDVHEIFTSFVRKLLTIGFFLLILLNGHMLSWDVIQAFKATGVAAAGEPHTGMGWILNTGRHIFDACMKGPKGQESHTGVWSWIFDTSSAAKATLATIIGMLTGLIVGFIAIFALIYMALEYLAVQIEAILVASLGVILLGFGGSRFTASYVEGYIKYAVSVGIRFFVLVVWIAFIEDKAPGIIANLIAGVEHKAGGTIPSMMEAYGDVLIFVLLIAWLTKKLPSIASSILTGGSSLSGGELAGGIMKGVALATAAVATGGAVAAGVAGAAGASGAAASLSEATGAAGSEGAVSLGGSTGGSATNGGASGASQGVPAPKAPAGGGSSGGTGTGGTGNAQGVPAPSSSTRTSGSASTSTQTQSGTASAPAPASGSRTSESLASSEPSGAQAPEPAKGTEEGTQVRTSTPSETQAGVDHRASAPNESPSPSSGGGSGKGAQAPASGGQSAPVPAPASRGQAAPTPAPVPAPASAPAKEKAPSFLDRAGQHEKKMQQVMDHISPGEPSTGSVSAPNINVKHLSD